MATDAAYAAVRVPTYLEMVPMWVIPLDADKSINGRMLAACKSKTNGGRKRGKICTGVSLLHRYKGKHIVAQNESVYSCVIICSAKYKNAQGEIFILIHN
jgi:hypothetical protein